MVWTPIPVKYITLVFAIVLAIVNEAEVSGKCKNKNLKCYDCDNRYDIYCDIPFNQSLPAKPRIRECDGCCVTFLYTVPDGGLWIQRSCTEVALIDYFMSSITENCTSKKMKAENCFCQSNYCNGALHIDQSQPEVSISTDRAPSLTSSPFYNNISLESNHGSFVKKPVFALFKFIMVFALILVINYPLI